MKKFTPSINNLKDTLSIQTYSHDYKEACKFIIKRLSNMNGVVYSKDVHDNFYATKGKVKPDESYPCVVAHHDTVHRITDNKTIRKMHDYFYAFDDTQLKQVGTGGDDLVGVWAALEILEFRDVCKIALFSQEEIGCVGSGAANMEFFKDVGYVFQTDRKGNSDFVTDIGGVQLSSKEFQAEIKPVLDKHKYKCTNGGLTDVKTLTTRGIGVCTANMSSGYYRPHSDSEIVSIKDARNVCKMMNGFIDKLGHTKWELEYKTPSYNYNNLYAGYGGGYGGYNGWDAWGRSSSKGTTTRSYNEGWQSKSRGSVKSSWSKNGKSLSKTQLKGKKIQGFLKKGFNTLSLNEVKSFVDTMKFYSKAVNLPPIQCIEDLMPTDFDVSTELSLRCEICNTDTMINTEYAYGDIEYMDGDIDNLGDSTCSVCYNSQDFYEDMKLYMADLKMAEQQYLLEFNSEKNDKNNDKS